MNTYSNFADQAYEGLIGWYDWGSGLWHDKHDIGWWNCANALTAVIDYSRIRPLANRDTLLHTTFSKTKGSSGGFRYYPHSGFAAGVDDFFGGTWDEQTVYDDEAWWALAWLAAYDVTRIVDYLDMARQIFNNMTSAWWWPCGGGLWWNTPQFTGPYGEGWWDPEISLVEGTLLDPPQYYKNAIVNELLFAVAAKLYRATGTGIYLYWAHAALSWFDNVGLQNSNHLINDGLYLTMSFPTDGEPSVTFKNNGAQPLTYLQGVILGGLADMYTITGKQAYLDRGWDIFNAVWSSSSGFVDPATGALVEPVGPSKDACQFKGIFMRNLSYLFEAEDSVDRQATYAGFFANNADSLWNRARHGNHFGYKWEGPFDDDDATRQTSALDALVAAVRLDSPYSGGR